MRESALEIVVYGNLVFVFKEIINTYRLSPELVTIIQDQRIKEEGVQRQ